MRAAPKHRPSSHPLVQRERVMRLGQVIAAMDLGDHPLDAISAVSARDQSARIEDLAQRVVLMPETPLTGEQRRSLLVLARELTRRAQVAPLTRRS